jgi:hypothetical protein
MKAQNAKQVGADKSAEVVANNTTGADVPAVKEYPHKPKGDASAETKVLWTDAGISKAKAFDNGRFGIEVSFIELGIMPETLTVLGKFLVENGMNEILQGYASTVARNHSLVGSYSLAEMRSDIGEKGEDKAIVKLAEKKFADPAWRQAKGIETIEHAVNYVKKMMAEM